MDSGMLYQNRPGYSIGLISLEDLNDLVSKGFDINEQDDKGNTYLHIFAYDNNIFPIRLLCEGGANLDIKNNKGFTPYQISYARKGHEHPDRICRLLLSYGASVPLYENLEAGNE